VVINDPDLCSYASQGQFADLTERVAASKVIQASHFFKGPATSDHWHGRQYSVAREINTICLYYNAEMFRAKGVDPDKPPTNWSELKAAAAKLTDTSKHVFGLGFCAHSSEQSTFQFLPFLRQAGDAIDRLDQPEATEALQFRTASVMNGQVSRDVINQPQYRVAGGKERPADRNGKKSIDREVEQFEEIADGTGQNGTSARGAKFGPADG
jgi:multiple sugar transport system substrate-binding protein